MKQKHHEKEQYINMLAQDKEEMKVQQIFGLLRSPQINIGFISFILLSQMKLAELQDLVMRLVAERNDWYTRYTGAVTGAGTVNPDVLPIGQDHAGSEYPAQSQTEPNAASGAGTRTGSRS